MTSKTLFFKLIKQDVKKRVWCPIIIFLGYFLAFEVNMLRMIGRIEERTEYTYALKDILEYVEKVLFGSNVKAFAVLACLAAFLCAVSGFSYLHSRVQLDLYQSLPANRTQTFLAKYVSGVLQFFLPFAIHVVICMGIAAGKAAFSGVVFGNAIKMVGVVSLVFLLSYGMCLMAVCLTGNIIISVFGCIVLFFYSSVVSVLTSSLFQTFFPTYMFVSIEGNGLDYTPYWRFSPVSMLVDLFEPRYTGAFRDDTYFRYNADCLWKVAAAMLVYTLIAYVLYRKRASEAAGKAIAFWWAESVIKTMLVLPAALMAGLFFREIAPEKGVDTWYLFGVVFGFALAAVLLEIIFRLDIRGALCHKKQFVFNAACLAVIVLVLRFDVLGYNTYVPADSELESCAVSLEGLMSVSPAKSSGYGRTVWYTYIGTTDYRMGNVKLQGNPSVMDLARKAAKEQLTYEGDDEAQKDYKAVAFGYNLKNGKHIYRMYTVDMADAQTKALVADIFNDSSYKTGTSPMLSDGWKKEYRKLYGVGTFGAADLDMTPEFQAKLLETYQEEYLQLDFDTVLDTYPVGCFSLLTDEEYQADLDWRHGARYDRYDGSLIYPQFTKTIALLKEHGFDVYEMVDMEDIDFINVIYCKENMEFDGEGVSYVSYDYVEVGSVYDAAQQEELLNQVINTDYGWQVRNYADIVDGDFEISIHSKTDNEALQRKFDFKKGQIPQFIYEMEGYQKAME